MTSQVSSPAEQADAAVSGPSVAGTGGSRNRRKEIRRLDRVIIRFAGDSGDGMQLTGDRFTSETASFGNDLSTLPNFPAEIRAPAGTLPGVSVLPAALRRPRHPDAGRRPERAGRDEPGRAEGEHRRRAARRGDHRQHRRVHQAGRWRRSATRPTRWRTARWTAYRVHPVPLTTLTVEALKEFGLSRKEAERSKNMFALGPAVVDVPPADRGHREVPAAEVRQEAARSPRRTSPRSGRAGTSARPPRTSPSPTRSPRPTTRLPGRHVPQHLRQPGAVLRPDRRRAGRRICRSSWARTRSPRPPTSCTSCRKHKNFGVRTFQAEDEIAGIGAALGAAFGGSLAVTTTSGPGVALKSETIGLAVSLELPLLVVDIQRGGPSTGLPTKTEQADLLQAMYGRNGEAPVPVVAPRTPAGLLRRRARGGPDRADLPHPGVPALRRLPGQRLGALADPGGRRTARICGCSSPPGPNHELADGTEVFWPYKRDPQTLARPWAVPGHAGPGAPHRRHREAGRHRQHLLRPGQPRPHGPHPAGQDRRHRRPRPGGRRPATARPHAGAGLGLDLRADHRRRAPAARGRAARSPRPICATSTPSRAISARSWRVTTR